MAHPSDCKAKPGTEIPVVTRDSTTITLSGDWTNTPLWLGVPYEFLYTFSEPLARDVSKGKPMPSMTGRTQVRNLDVVYAGSGEFEVEVDHLLGSSFTAGFVAPDFETDGQDLPGLTGGNFSVPVAANNHEVVVSLKSSSVLPCIFQSATWELFHHDRSRYT